MRIYSDVNLTLLFLRNRICRFYIVEVTSLIFHCLTITLSGFGICQCILEGSIEGFTMLLCHVLVHIRGFHYVNIVMNMSVHIERVHYVTMACPCTYLGFYYVNIVMNVPVHNVTISCSCTC